MRNKHHFLLVCFPAEGHINPCLELARRLTNLGHYVTFATTIVATRRIMNKVPTHLTSTQQGQPLLSFATFSDHGFDDEEEGGRLKPDRSPAQYFSDLNRHGSQSLTNLIISNQQGPLPPFTFLIYTLLLNWAGDVADAFHISSALLFVQPATLLALYYYYFHGYGDTAIICSQEGLPGLPLLLTSHDMPSFLSPSSPHAFLAPLFKQQLQFPDQGSQSSKVVLVNTFDALEMQALIAIQELKMLPIGPLIPFDHNKAWKGKNSSNNYHYCYIEWLNSKPISSVVYISFGSVCVLSNRQEEKIVDALLESGYTFLWVMRSKGEEYSFEKDEENSNLKRLQEGEKGKIVPWCCQIEVLNHPSLGCFMTHCGWNSSIECLASGLPMVAFPQQIDQPTNAKLIEDVWKTGVRVKANSQGIVEKEEIRRCLDLVMGTGHNIEQKKQIMENAKKWKDLATQAIGEHGTSCLNLKAFVEQIDANSG